MSNPMYVHCVQSLGCFAIRNHARTAHARESKAVLDSGFHVVDSGFPGGGFQSLSVELGSRLQLSVGFRIP